MCCTSSVAVQCLFEKKVSSHETSKGWLPIWLAIRPMEVIGSSTGTSRFFSGLGLRRAFYKIKNICIKLYVIYKYKYKLI